MKQEDDEEAARIMIKKVLFTNILVKALEVDMKDFQNLEFARHMLKYHLDKHKDEKIDNTKFGMKILKVARTAFERQGDESVLIQIEKQDDFTLNSKSEYNRCALPRQTAKVRNFLR